MLQKEGILKSQFCFWVHQEGTIYVCTTALLIRYIFILKLSSSAVAVDDDEWVKPYQ